MVVGVRRHRRPQPGLHPAASCRLAASGQVPSAVAGTQRLGGGDPVQAYARGREPARRVEDRPPRMVRPAAVVRREHREVVLVGRCDGTRWDDHQRLVVHDQLTVPLGQQLLDAAFSALRVRTPIAGDVDGTGADLVGQRRDLPGGVAAADHQAVGAALLQRLVEVAQGIHEERRPVGMRGTPSRGSSSRTNTGSTCSAESIAPCRVGLSCTRRSRVNKAIAVLDLLVLAVRMDVKLSNLIRIVDHSV